MEGGRGEGKGSQQNNPLSPRAASQKRDSYPAREGQEATAQEQTTEDNGENKEEKGRDRETPQGGVVKVTRVGGGATPPEEKGDLL